MSELEDRINTVLNDPAQMEKITRLARSFMGGGEGGENADSPETVPGIDPSLLGKLGRIMGTNSPPSRNQQLLEAMKPYFSEKRRRKIDRAMKLARFAKLAETAMREAGGEEDA